MAGLITPAHASEAPVCNASTSNEWLRQSNGSPVTEPLSAERVHLVIAKLDEAITKLAFHPYVSLKAREAAAFTGQFGGLKGQPNLHPYLVRAVYPVRNPKLNIVWDGKNLDVFAFGLGCAPYTKHPIVVLLEQAPTDIHVMASAAL